MNNQRTRFFIAYAFILALWFYVVPRFFPQLAPQPRHPPTPVEIAQQTQALRDKAARAELEARTSQTRLSVGDRAKKWDEAIQAFREIEGKVQGDAAIDAKIQEARLHEERARTDAKSTSDYDQAERIYKDLERQHARDRATITLNGRPTQVVVGEYAREKLEAVLYARDLRQRHSPLYKLLDFFVALTGRVPGFSYWFALLLITLIIKALLFPLTKKQFKSMADMQRIAPLMKEVQEKLKGRPADEINRKVMALYKEHGVNPAAGCVPMVAQMAVLWPLYSMIRLYEYQFRKGYFLWIGSALSREYPRFIAPSLAATDLPLLLLYLVSMFLTSRLQPPAADPQQAQQQKMMAYFMPLVFGYWTWTAAWPSAFTLYWLIMNVISTWQQWHILRTVGSPVPTRPPQSSSPPDRGSPPQRGGPSNGGGSSNGNGRGGSRPLKPGEAKRSGSKKAGRR